ncbi:VWA domain-containing protein [Persicimonas caeni]|uniref:VWA domain-containing protein n=1 Tax=Persicimonas caeni TaxID=2292766 RepID=A0A4Y6PY12_PERCE|nr:vWA domain-containing protein [Persicimonas caeni]QDG52887.1 VWA domain-containing protein [Persicimonas caeni]QED34109.1 VWA domain-containing protein [Persicimonas caeni]
MTKRQDVGSSWISKIRRGGTALAAIGLLGSLGVAASGCDTVALISFSERSFTNIHSSGFTAPPGSCGGVQSGDGEMRLRFVVTDDENRPIRLGEAVDNQSVELDSDSVVLSNGALMQVDELQAPCADSTCDASNGFTCGTAPGLESSSTDDITQCVKVDQGLTVKSESSAVQFVADNDEHQVFGVLLENAGSLDGAPPPGSRGYWDKNGNGVTGDSEDLGTASFAIRETATDADYERTGAVSGVYTAWQEAYKLAFGERRKTYFGLWGFDESTTASPTSYIEQARGGGSEWSNDKGEIESAVYLEYSDASPAREQRANVYESINSVINNQYSTDKMNELGLDRADSVDKQLVVFVDGYDEMRENDGVDIEQVIQTAKENNVRLFVVHLDPKLEDPELLREDPMYPEGQDPCSDNSECKNYEECRQPRGYTDNPGETPTSPGTYAMDQTYCIPKRDEFGRTGPIHDYSRIACETGGGYIYVSSTKSLRSRMEWTPYALDGLWEARVTSGEIFRGKVPFGEALRVHSDMTVTVSGDSRTYSFSQIGSLETGGDSNADDFDTRGVVFATE